MSAEVPPPPAWHPDPTGRHGQRWWDGTRWTEHVADGQATASDPLAPPPPPARGATPAGGGPAPAAAGPDPAEAQRAEVDRFVRASDDGHPPEGWPDRYEPAIAEALHLLAPDEVVRAAWRMRTSGPRARISDAGVLLVTDRQVLGADRSPKSHGHFAIPLDQVASVVLVHRTMGRSDFGYSIRLAAASDATLGPEESPADFQVFETGRDPSRWDAHPAGEADLAEVQAALVALVPAAAATRRTIDLTPAPHQSGQQVDLSTLPPPPGAASAPPPAAATSTPAENQPPASASATPAEDAPATMSWGSALGSLVVAALVLGFVGIAILDILDSDCEQSGMTMVCVSTGGGMQVEMTYNLLLLGVAAVLGILGALRGLAGVAQNLGRKQT